MQCVCAHVCVSALRLCMSASLFVCASEIISVFVVLVLGGFTVLANCADGNQNMQASNL